LVGQISQDYILVKKHFIMDAGAIHFLAGAAGGTAGAVLTCPLEVVKTRLQSSSSNFGKRYAPVTPCLTSISYSTSSAIGTVTPSCESIVIRQTRTPNLGLYQNLKCIVQNEGPKALFKGLGPNLVGVAPSRAIYFWAYSQSKRVLNESGLIQPDSPFVHILAAASAGFSSSTFTNPIWFIKTRLQLDQQINSRLTALQCMSRIYREHGIFGFYKGITASYYGLSETMLHFVVYEEIKILLREAQGRSLDDDDDERSFWQFFEYMGAGATSKTIATCVAYPHEVARTRLREEGSRYKSFWQTLLWSTGRKGSGECTAVSLRSSSDRFLTPPS